MVAGELALLYSGGKDSSLAALFLADHYDVTLCTASFGITDDWRHARDAADALDLAFDRVDLDRSVAEDAVERLREDGFPRHAIQSVHEHALETVAALDYDAVADGTRRDDRAPALDRADAQSLEDRHGVDYVRPLAGFGRGAVDRLVAETLEVTVGPSEEVPKGDYETELRALLAERHGEDAIPEIFPEHDQTRVTGLRE